MHWHRFTSNTMRSRVGRYTLLCTNDAPPNATINKHIRRLRRNLILIYTQSLHIITYYPQHILHIRTNPEYYYTQYI